jgi:hypothetical protein
MQEAVVQWLWRIVATLAIAVVCHIWRLDTSTAAPDIGSRLQEEWKPQQEEATTDCSLEAFGAARQAGRTSQEQIYLV